MRFLSIFRRTPAANAGGPLASLIQSIERNPRKDPPYIDFLAACEQRGDFDGAIAYLANLLGRKPRLETAYRFLLVAYRRKGDLQGLKQLIAQHPKNDSAHSWFLMDAYTKSDWDSAIVLLSVLVRLQPHEDNWARYLLTAYEMKRDPNAAIQGATELLKVCPDNGVLRDFLEDARRKNVLRAAHDETAARGTERTPAIETDATALRSSTNAPKTEWQKTLELKDKLQEIDSKERARRKVEDEMAFRPRALSSREKFNKIKPTGSRDGFG